MPYNRNLLVLASKIIKADSSANQVEIEYVRKYFISNYGERKSKRAFRQFKRLILDTIPTEKTCKKVNDLLTYDERFDFIEFLFSVARSDGEVTQEEEIQIREIASYLYIKKKIISTYNLCFLSGFISNHRIRIIIKRMSMKY